MTRAVFDRATWFALIFVAVGCTVEYDAARDSATQTGGLTDSGSASDTEADAEAETEPEAESEADCDAVEVLCDDICVRLEVDIDHCGECDVACADETLCLDGVCRRPCEDGCDSPREVCVGSFCDCAPGLTSCRGECVDLDTDTDHCGDCDEVCEDDWGCGDGECLPPGCDGFGDDCDGACTDTASNPLHCGDCFRECGIDEVCVEGDCFRYDTFPSDVCGECPCPAVCDTPADQCCFFELIEEDICVYGPACPQ